MVLLYSLSGYIRTVFLIVLITQPSCQELKPVWKDLFSKFKKKKKKNLPKGYAPFLCDSGTS